MRILFCKKQETCMGHLANIWWRCHRSPGLPGSSWAWTRPSSAGPGSRSSSSSLFFFSSSSHLLIFIFFFFSSSHLHLLIFSSHLHLLIFFFHLAAVCLPPARFQLSGQLSRVNLRKPPSQRISCQSGLHHPIEMKFFLVHLNTHSCQKT